MTPNRYYPGQGVRSLLVSLDVNGNLVDPPTPTVTIVYPDRSQATATAIRDSTGNWHADFAVPFPMQGGVGWEVWRSTGSLPSQNAQQATAFVVQEMPS